MAKTQSAQHIDPVCQTEVDPNKAAGKSILQGKTYYFCSMDCKRQFDINFQAYVKAA